MYGKNIRKGTTQSSIKIGENAYEFRKEKIERSFADSKELHWLTVVGCVD